MSLFRKDCITLEQMQKSKGYIGWWKRLIKIHLSFNQLYIQVQSVKHMSLSKLVIIGPDSSQALAEPKPIVTLIKRVSIALSLTTN